MKRTAISGLILTFTLAMGLVVVAVEDKKANELLEAALTKETIEGDLKGAITLYERAVKEAGSNRALAVKAQLRLASAYQKQGNDQALVIYERILRDYADLSDAAAEARSRLSALKGAGPANGTAITIPTTPNTLPPQRQVTLFDRQGKILGTVGGPGTNGTMTLSPDGKRVALVRLGRTSSDTARSIVVFDVRTQSSKKLTSGPVDVQPTWSADGKRIAFQVRSATPGRSAGIYTIASDGSGKEEFVAPASQQVTLVSWSPDGRFLTYQQVNPQTNFDLYVIPVSGASRTPIPILATSAPESGLRISPDGRYISYRLNLGRNDAYVSPFDPAATDPARAIERWKISADGLAPAGIRWRSDGKEIYFIDSNGGVNAVEVTTTPSFKAGTPKVLFQVPKAFHAAPDTNLGDSDVSADGKIFALMMPVTPK